VRIRLNSIIVATAVLILLSLELTLAATQAGQQGGGAGTAAQGGQRGGRGANANLPPAGPAPRLPNGKPDLSGHWNNPYAPNMAGARGANALDPMTRMRSTGRTKASRCPTQKVRPRRTIFLTPNGD